MLEILCLSRATGLDNTRRGTTGRCLGLGPPGGQQATIDLRVTRWASLHTPGRPTYKNETATDQRGPSKQASKRASTCKLVRLSAAAHLRPAGRQACVIVGGRQTDEPRPVSLEWQRHSLRIALVCLCRVAEAGEKEKNTSLWAISPNSRDRSCRASRHPPCNLASDSANWFRHHQSDVPQGKTLTSDQIRVPLGQLEQQFSSF